MTKSYVGQVQVTYSLNMQVEVVVEDDEATDDNVEKELLIAAQDKFKENELSIMDDTDFEFEVEDFQEE